MHEIPGADDFSAEGGTDRLMAKTDTE